MCCTIAWHGTNQDIKDTNNMAQTLEEKAPWLDKDVWIVDGQVCIMI